MTLPEMTLAIRRLPPGGAHLRMMAFARRFVGPPLSGRQTTDLLEPMEIRCRCLFQLQRGQSSTHIAADFTSIFGALTPNTGMSERP